MIGGSNGAGISVHSPRPFRWEGEIPNIGRQGAVRHAERHGDEIAEAVELVYAVGA